MHGAAGNRLVKVDIAIADLYIESAVGVAAHPCLVVNWRSLAPKVGQREQATAGASSALRPTVVYRILHSSHLLRNKKRGKYITTFESQQVPIHKSISSAFGQGELG